MLHVYLLFFVFIEQLFLLIKSNVILQTVLVSLVLVKLCERIHTRHAVDKDIRVNQPKMYPNYKLSRN